MKNRLKHFVFLATLCGVALVAVPAQAAEYSLKPGLTYGNGHYLIGQSEQVLVIKPTTAKLLNKRGEKITNVNYPVKYNNKNNIYLSTKKSISKKFIRNTVYTYNIKTGGIQYFFSETLNISLGDQSLRAIGSDGKKVVFIRDSADPTLFSTYFPCDTSFAWYVFSYRDQLFSLNMTGGNKRLVKYVAPTVMLDNGKANWEACWTPYPLLLPQTPTAPLETNTTSSAKTAVVAPNIAGCKMFPSESPWNLDVSAWGTHPYNTAFTEAIGLDKFLYPDFNSNLVSGVPFSIVDRNQPKVPVTFIDYPIESDPGPYPIPDNASAESGSNRHLLVLDKDNCKLYELSKAEKNLDAVGGWKASSGAVFDLSLNALRPENWISANASGLPVLPGLVRYEEVIAGEIKHALSFTAPSTQQGHIHPATHHAGAISSSLPPMGLRLRLKASFDISGYSPTAKVILLAMKKYGLILADTGASWGIQGAPDSRWNDAELNELKKVPGSAFETVYSGEIIK